MTEKDFTNWDKRYQALGKLSNQPIILLAAEWAWSVLPIFEKANPSDDRARKALEVTYKWVETGTVEGLHEAAYGTLVMGSHGAPVYAARAAYYAAYGAYGVVCTAHMLLKPLSIPSMLVPYAADNVVYVAHYAAYADASWTYLYNSYLRALGKDWTFDPKWKTETTISLAKTIYRDRAFYQMPILADALEENGCNYPDLLLQLRSPEHATRADWVLENLNFT